MPKNDAARKNDDATVNLTILKCRSFNGRNRKSLLQNIVSFHRKEISYLVSLTSFGVTVEWTIDSYFGGGEWNFKSS